ncbi:uncharacterized protein N7498_006580 [Penicillium cinerascens]|uniref:Uncharacterized protein n=1 Tax=Penicillium cinerascens TaxID=70096 RepID=A0A9W9SXJ9_9EURO|nr:uncharacterized protein N7498_006580 [Penicillium cinerascens]KAJ5201917.1 hypothetical protein N7498_006580 [Penicillium cinerascens]
MDSNAKAQRDQRLTQLYDEVDDYESVFLSPKDLQACGIQASQVDITEDGTLLFNPCYFRPHPERVLEKYPLDPLKQATYIPYLNFRLDLDTLFERIKKGSPGIKHEDAVELTNHEFRLKTEMFAGNWSRHAHATERHIMGQITAHPRKGRPGLFSFFDLGSPRMYWRTKPRRGEWPLINYLVEDGPQRRYRQWEAFDLREDSRKKSPQPHATLTTVAHVAADDADHCLTSSEVKAILATLVIRTSRDPFQDYRTHPILVFSYTGRKHGRIIQATLDDQSLNLQYSQLWSFEDDDTAPVELFVRYMISESVEPERSTIVEPMARLNIT